MYVVLCVLECACKCCCVGVYVHAYVKEGWDLFESHTGPKLGIEYPLGASLFVPHLSDMLGQQSYSLSKLTETL